MTVVDASRGGVCVETPAQLAVGDVLYLEGPQQPDGGADFEVLRADPMARNRYGGRFLEEAAGNALFEQLVEAARAERAARRTRAERTRARSRPRRRTTSRRRAACTSAERHIPRVFVRFHVRGLTPFRPFLGSDPATEGARKARGSRDGSRSARVSTRSARCALRSAG